MPTLDFKGKPFVYSHHLSVPFRELKIDAAKSLPGKAGPSLDDNLIIHGDNLHALKALLPKYAGKVDVIYIDPPYNTGEEKWAYNDNVNSPLMRAWLEKTTGANPAVDKDDLERHDKWLCMIWPRLQILKELLSPTGSIFISIDENEYMHLRMAMNEIFGTNTHVATIVWQKRYSRENREAIGDVHEYILAYSNDPAHFKKVRNLVEPTKEQMAVYRNPNNDPRGDWRPIPITAQAGHATKEQFYEIKAPNGKVHTPPEGRCWGISQATFEDLRKNGRIYFGQDNNSQPNLIRYSDEVDGFVPWTWWPSEEVGHTDEAKKEIYSLLGRSFDFDTPKPTRLLNRILEIATSKTSIVLDSFAGSGTTAHSVLRLNAEDGGNRKFILVECEDYADELTAERNRRVIDGYQCEQNFKEEIFQEKLTPSKLKKMDSIIQNVELAKKQSEGTYKTIKEEINKGVYQVFGVRKKQEKIDGLGGSFTYCDLGDPIDMESFFDDSGSMPAYDQLSSYIAYTATGEALGKAPKKPAKDWFIGEVGGVRLHLIYKPNGDFMKSHQAALDMDTVKTIAASNKTGKPSYVFAAAKYMGQNELTRDYDMTFCQLPYAIHRIMGDGVDG